MQKRSTKTIQKATLYLHRQHHHYYNDDYTWPFSSIRYGRPWYPAASSVCLSSSAHTSTDERISSAVERSSRFRHWSSAEFPKDKSSDQSCSCSPQWTPFCSSKGTTSVHTSTPTILKFMMIHVICRQRLLWEKRWVTAWNLTLRKLRCCGARPVDGNNRSNGNPHVSAPISWCLPDQYATWAYLDSEVSMKAHVFRNVSSCFNVLRQIHFIRRSVTRPVLQSLVESLVLSRLNYGNVALAGLPARELSRLQSVKNADARLIFLANEYNHVSSILRDIHWLQAPQRID